MDNIKTIKPRRESGLVRNDIDRLSERLEKHIDDFNEHQAIFNEHLKANELKIEALCKNTASLVDAWETLGGAVKFGTAIGKLIKWIGGFAVILALIDWFSKHAIK